MLGLWAVVFTVAVAGCGDDDDDGGGGGGGDAGGGESFTIAAVTALRGEVYQQNLACGVEAVAEEEGIEVNLQEPERYDPALQVRVLESVAATQPEGLVVVPDDATTPFAVIKQIADTGAPVVLLGGTLERADEVAESVVLGADVSGGELAGEQMVESTGGEGKVLIVTDSPANVIQRNRIDGFKSAIEGSNLEIVSTEYAQGDVAKAASAVTATLAREPDLSAIYTTGGVEIAGVADALRREAEPGQVTVIAWASGPPEAELLEQGQADALIVERPYEQGRQAMEQLANALNERPVEEELITDAILVTEENLDSKEAQDNLTKAC